MSKKFFLVLFFASMFQISHATIYDDRFIPLFVPQQFFIEGLPSAYEFDFVAITASEAFAIVDGVDFFNITSGVILQHSRLYQSYFR